MLEKTASSSSEGGICKYHGVLHIRVMKNCFFMLENTCNILIDAGDANDARDNAADDD